MSNQQTILLGNLRLVGERTKDANLVMVEGDEGVAFCILASEWQSLVAVAAVVEAARAVKELDEIETGFGGGLNCGSKMLVDKVAELYDALDTLTAGGEK